MIELISPLTLHIFHTSSTVSQSCSARRSSLSEDHRKREDHGVADSGDPAVAVGGEEGGGEGVGGEEEEEPAAEAGQGGGAGRDREVQEGEGAAGDGLHNGRGTKTRNTSEPSSLDIPQ